MIMGLCAQALSLTFILHQTLRMLPRILFTTGCVILLTYTFMVPKVRRIKFPHENLMEGFWTFLESVDGRVLRRVVIGMVYFAPTLVEMVALLLLSGMIAEGQGGWMKIGLCWLSILVQGGVLLRSHFDIRFTSEIVNDLGDEERKPFPTRYWGNGKYIIGNITLMAKSESTLFQCKVHGWIYLYFMTLMTATIQVTMHRIHQPLLLSGPFLVATGAFLVLSVANDDDGEDDFFLSILQKVLRRSLHDVLLEVGDSVEEDEMLRLAMLRWIIDYWASVRKSTKQCDNESIPTHEIGTRSGIVEDFQRDTSTLPRNTSTVSTHNPSCIRRNVEDDSELEWSRLYPMLNMTTDQMLQEVNNGDQEEENISVNALKQMLSCLNCHERAKPAIESYKRAIHELSPTRSVAIYVGIAYRCPAIISCFFLYLLQPIKANQCTVVLLPLILFEMMRLSEWIYVCGQIRRSPCIHDEKLQEGTEQNEHNWVTSLFPNEVSAMEILLCKDDYESHQSGTAIHVWLNLCQSVKALESGLTAMKCVQTAQVASDLAFNIVSLTKVVKDVSHEGIVGGAALIFLDLFHFHLEKRSSTHRENARGSGGQRETFVKAAFDLVENSQRLTKHVNELAEDTIVRTTVFSFVSFLMNGIRGNSRSDQETEHENTLESKELVSEETSTIDLTDRTVKSMDITQIDLDYDTRSHDASSRGDDDDDDVSWTAIRRPKSETADLQDIPKAVNEIYTGHNLKWIGAAGAILGTVVGGIALASNKPDRVESQDDNSKRKARSSVVIEQLDNDS